MFSNEEERFDHVATVSEAINEWAWNVGAEPGYVNLQWLVSSYDTIERNPHYHGPEQQHPEDPRSFEEWEEDQRRESALFQDGTPVALFDDGNWGRARRVAA